MVWNLGAAIAMIISHSMLVTPALFCASDDLIPGQIRSIRQQLLIVDSAIEALVLNRIVQLDKRFLPATDPADRPPTTIFGHEVVFGLKYIVRFASKVRHSTLRPSSGRLMTILASDLFCSWNISGPTSV